MVCNLQFEIENELANATTRRLNLMLKPWLSTKPINQITYGILDVKGLSKRYYVRMFIPITKGLTNLGL